MVHGAIPCGGAGQGPAVGVRCFMVFEGWCVGCVWLRGLVLEFVVLSVPVVRAPREVSEAVSERAVSRVR